MPSLPSDFAFTHPKRGVGLEPTNPRSCSPGPCQLEYPLKKLRAAKGLLIAAPIKTQSPKLREAGSSFLIPGINRRLRLSPTYYF